MKSDCPKIRNEPGSRQFSILMYIRNLIKFTSLRIFLLTGSLFYAILLVSCNAPHDNLFDPESEWYQGNPVGQYELDDFDTRVRSLHTSQIFPTVDSYSLLAEVWTEELIPIDSVTICYPGRNPVHLTLTSRGIWATLFSPSYFNVEDPYMESVIGQPFRYNIFVRHDAEYVAEPVYLFRVIEETPVLISPVQSDTVGTTVELHWQPFDVAYLHWFRASVWRNEFEFEAEVWSSDTLSSVVESVVVSGSLSQGSYYWTLYVIDEFDNYSRSRENEFIVLEGFQP